MMKKLIFLTIALACSLSQVIHAQNKNCSLDFEWEQLSPTEYQLFAFSIPDSLEYVWELSSGNTYSGQNPIIQLQPDSVFTVCLSVINDSLECETVCDSVFTFYEDCFADFLIFQGNNPSELFFESVSDGLPPFSYYWLVSGDTVGFEPSLTYTFPENGFYEVCLIIHSSSGCQDTYCEEIFIDDIQPECAVSFTSDVSKQFATFTPEPTGMAPYLFLWEINEIEISTDEVLTYEFPEAGEYTVCLHLTTLDSCYADYCETITITDIEDYYYISGHVYGNDSPLSSGQLDCYLNDEYLKSIQIIDGNFTITHLFNGEYKLLAISENEEYSDTWLGNSDIIEDASVISLLGNTWDVDIHMQSTNSIHLPSKIQLKVFPNPFNEEIHIESPERIESIKIINQSGKLVYISTEQEHFNLQHLKSGVYILEVMTRSGITHQKLIKQ